MAETDRPTVPNDACTHPRVTHMHGTYACYVVDKCRCEDCRAARAAAGRVQQRHRLYVQHGMGDYAPYVSADRARDHVDALRAAGMGYKSIARRAGVAASVVGSLLWETPSRGRGVRIRLTRDAEQKLLAVPVPTPRDLPPGRRIDAIPTGNRLRALIRLGYSQTRITIESGLPNSQAVRAVVNGAQHTTVRTHNAVNAAFTRLWATPYEPTDWREKIAASRARSWAEGQGWPLPVELDEDGHVEPVDDDDGLVDWIAIRRVIDGEGSARLSSLETDEAIRYGLALGKSAGEVADLLRLGKAAVEKRIARKSLRAGLESAAA